MHRPSKKTAIVIAVGLFLGAAALVGAVGHGWSRGPGHGPLALAFHGGRLLEQLQLRPEQQAHLDAIHAVLESRRAEHADTHGEHLSALIDKIEQGTIDAAEVDAALDEHLQRFRATAAEITGELVPLVDSLDDDQRALLVEHLRQLEERLAERRAFFLHG